MGLRAEFGFQGVTPWRGSRAAQALVCLAALTLVPLAAAAEPRIALVLTNQAYTQPGPALTNTHRDGNLIAAALRQVGFAVTIMRDTKTEGELRAAASAHADGLHEMHGNVWEWVGDCYKDSYFWSTDGWYGFRNGRLPTRTSRRFLVACSKWFALG